MGGTIAVCLRKPNGEEFRMLRWTNPIPYYIHNIKFFNKDEEYIEEYLFQWREMKQDWEKNSKSKNFEFNMTDVYAPYDNKCLYPCSYGLILIDMVNDKILSLQGYTKIGFTYNHALSLANDGGIISDNDILEDYKQLYNNDRFLKIVDKMNNKILENKSFGELCNVPSQEFWEIEINTSPFSVEDFSETEEGVLSLKKRVLELGFNISAEEEKEWNKFIEHYDEEL